MSNHGWPILGLPESLRAILCHHHSGSFSTEPCFLHLAINQKLLKTFLFFLTTHMLCSLLCSWLVIYPPLAITGYFVSSLLLWECPTEYPVLMASYFYAGVSILCTPYIWVPDVPLLGQRANAESCFSQQSVCPPFDMRIFASLLGRKKWCLATVLIWISLMRKLELLFMDLLILPFWGNYLFVSFAHFFFFFPIGLVAFFFSICRSSLDIWVSP